MKMLTAQTIADEASIRTLGASTSHESKRAPAVMGVVPQHDNLDEELTARENLEVFAHLYRVPRECVQHLWRRTVTFHVKQHRFRTP
ncbi:hypothetical protein HGB48_16365 [Actinomadura latina]|uniref:Uncharacterized protein n=2 Tax=Actinomadura latina TaxID=163603 RepID=A0A846YWK5_9ACTN|nr:hypothetical protein [Actinomadura latina]